MNECGAGNWWQRRSIVRLQERIADLEAQYQVWRNAADATCNSGGNITGLVVDKIARFRGEIARLKTRLQNRTGETGK